MIGIVPMVIKRKKLNEDTFIEEASLLLSKERKLFDEKIKAFLTTLSSTVAIYGYRAFATWLILVEMYYCKYI